MLRVHELHKRFGDVIAVNGVSFTAPDGEITGLLGANGAGKSTTLAMICGLLEPDGGTIALDTDRTETGSRRGTIGALLDHQGLYARLTIRENIEYYARLQGLGGAELRRRSDAVLARFDLDGIAHRRAAGLSQGERLKVALARAIVHGPRHVLLDEPTNGLDVPTVRSFRALLRDMRDEGRCLIFSSHRLDDVRALCDRIVVISRGRVAAEDTVDGIACRTSATALEESLMALIGEDGTRTEAACARS
jgi:sodium transport system ATP-binding protein